MSVWKFWIRLRCGMDYGVWKHFFWRIPCNETIGQLISILRGEGTSTPYGFTCNTDVRSPKNFPPFFLLPCLPVELEVVFFNGSTFTPYSVRVCDPWLLLLPSSLVDSRNGKLFCGLCNISIPLDRSRELFSARRLNSSRSFSVLCKALSSTAILCRNCTFCPQATPS